MGPKPELKKPKNRKNGVFFQKSPKKPVKNGNFEEKRKTIRKRLSRITSHDTLFPRMIKKEVKKGSKRGQKRVKKGDFGHF